MRKVMIRSTETDKNPVYVCAQNSEEKHEATIERDEWTEVNEMLIEALKNTTQEITEPDLEYHRRFPHPMNDPPKTITRKVSRFIIDVKS